MRRPTLLSLLLACAIAAGFALVAPAWTDPGAFAPRTRFTDGHLLGAGLWGEALARGELPGLHTSLVGWPGGADLRPLLWPSALLAAVVGPAWAVSLTFSLVPAFNLASGWGLGRALGRSAAGCALLGGTLALHPWVLETLTNGQVEQAVLGGAALQLATAVWAVRAPSRRGLAAARTGARLLSPGLATALVGWAAPHLALAGAVLTGLWALPGLSRGGPARVRWLVVLVAVGAGALAVQAYHGPAFAPGTHVFAPKGSEGRPTALADLPEVASLAGLLFPPGARPDVPVHHPTWLGFCLLGAAAWGVAAVRRGAGPRRATEPPAAQLSGPAAELSAPPNELPGRAELSRTAGAPAADPPPHTLRALAIAGVFAVLALGPTLPIGAVAIPLPWSALAVIAPTVAKSMSAYRMVAGALLALAIAASAAPRDTRRGSFAALAVVALAFAEGPLAATRALPLPAQRVAVDASRAALARGAGPVLDLPLAGPACPGGAGHYLLEAAATGRPTPVLLTDPRAGYDTFPDLVLGLRGTFARADCARRLPALLAELPFTTIVLHHHDLDCPVSPRVATCLEGAFGPGATGGADVAPPRVPTGAAAVPAGAPAAVTWWELR